MSRGAAATLLLLVLALLGSALAVVYAKYQSRQLFVGLQQLGAARDRAETEWGRLQLELGTWGAQARVERIARRQLQMHLPAADEIVVIGR